LPCRLFVSSHLPLNGNASKSRLDASYLHFGRMLTRIRSQGATPQVQGLGLQRATEGPRSRRKLLSLHLDLARLRTLLGFNPVNPSSKRSKRSELTRFCSGKRAQRTPRLLLLLLRRSFQFDDGCIALPNLWMRRTTRHALTGGIILRFAADAFYLRF